MADPKFEMIEREITELRDDLNELRPLLAIYRSSKLLASLLVWIGGIIVGLSTIWLAFGRFLSEHTK